jgi:hypothetical protein
MPTVLRVAGFRFFFYSGDRGEPAHVHAEKDDQTAKFWLDPVRMHGSGGFNRDEIRRIQKIVEENRESFLRSWNECFDT